jgi:para-nitrobenzyl esterase
MANLLRLLVGVTLVGGITGDLVVNTSLGAVKGTLLRNISQDYWNVTTQKNVTLLNDVFEFVNIPFAVPPTGKRRFLPPLPHKGWQGVRDARTIGPACIQPNLKGVSAMIPTSEDCLQLNVWTNSKCLAKGGCATYFWIHGGGFDYGASSSYNGSQLAARGDIVVVTANYRLGVFGFLQHKQILAESGTTLGGMNALLDTLLSLQWTHANAASFGGDPSLLTIGGESAGAVATCMHAHSPLSSGLYAQLVMESGDCTGE